MVVIQRPLGAQRLVGGRKIARASVSLVPLGNENADVVRQAGKLADQGVRRIGLGALFVCSGDPNMVMPPVLEPLAMEFDLSTVERPVGLQPADDMPILNTTPFEDGCRCIPTITQHRDLVVGGNERNDCFQHLQNDLDFAPRGETFPFGAFAIELPHRLGPQIGSGVNGEAERADGDAQEHIDCSIGEHRLTTEGAGQISDPVH